MSNILITGASGFIGKSLYSKLSQYLKFNTIGTYRHDNINGVNIGNINGSTDWSQALHNVDVVIHTAARVHIKNEKEKDPLVAFRAVNVDGTINLAKQAAANNVKRLIFISSIGVNGKNSSAVPLTEQDTPSPHSYYAISKLEAEKGLRKIEKETGLEVVIIRPPLVYGPGAPGNIARLFKLVHRGIPLPFGRINNQRSLVSIDNLVDFITKCIEHPQAAGELFLVSDGYDVSTFNLTNYIAKAMNKHAWLLPIPTIFLRVPALLLGKKILYQQLCGSLQIDVTKAQNLLDWKPPVRINDTLKKSVEYFLVNK